MSTHPAKSTITEEEEEQGSVPQDIQEELPEVGQLSFTAQILGALAFIPVVKRAEVINAFHTMTGSGSGEYLIDFETKLYNLKHPKLLQQIVQDQKVVAKEIDRQKKRGKQRSATVGWGKLKRTIDYKTFDHQTQAIEVAKVLHRHITQAEETAKLQKTIDHFSLDRKQGDNLHKDFGEWRKSNPDAEADAFLTTQGTELQRIQSGKKLNRKEKKYSHETFAKQLQMVREEVVTKNKGVVDCGERLIRRSLNTDRELLTPDELKKEIAGMIQGLEQPPENAPESALSASLPEQEISALLEAPVTQSAEPQEVTPPAAAETPTTQSPSTRATASPQWKKPFALPRRPGLFGFRLPPKLANAILSITTALSLQAGAKPTQQDITPPSPTPIVQRDDSFSLNPPPNAPVSVPSVPAAVAPSAASRVSVPASAPRFSFLPSGLQNMFSNISNRLSSFTSPISSFINKLGPAGNFLTGGLGGLAKTGLSNLASKLITNGALKAGVNAALGAATGGLWTAATAINDAIRLLSKTLLGVDVNILGTAGKIAVVALIGVIIVPMVMDDHFSTGETVAVLPQPEEAHTVIGWNDFEEEFLIADSPVNRKQITLSGWEQFEERHLLSQGLTASKPTTHN